MQQICCCLSSCPVYHSATAQIYLAASCRGDGAMKALNWNAGYLKSPPWIMIYCSFSVQCSPHLYIVIHCKYHVLL